jgi:hypothetical protein
LMMTNRIEQLKQVKVPIWAKWLGAYKAWQRRRNARKEIHYIATVYAWTYWTDHRYYSKQWYILKQNGVGKRFYEYGCTTSLLEGKEKLHSSYASFIAPWLHNHYTNQEAIEFARRSEQCAKVD